MVNPMAGRHRATRGRQKSSPRVVETSDYVAMTQRILYGYGNRIADDPAALVHLRDIEQTLRDAVNVGIYLANRGTSHYSQNEQADILGVSRQAMAKRMKLGEAVHVVLEASRSMGAVVRLADVRAQRARLLAAAGVHDVTGSDRERAAEAV